METKIYEAIILILTLILSLVFVYFFMILRRKKVTMTERRERKKNLIFHVTTRESYQNCREKIEFYKDGCHLPCYRGDTLEKSGFIHCSSESQLPRTIERFKTVPNLILLVIDRRKLVCIVKYEDMESNQNPYPHVYGPINLTAVDSVIDLIPDKNGNIIIPKF